MGSKKTQWCPENDQVSAMGSTTTPLPVKLKLAMPGNRNAQRNPWLWAMPWPCHGHAMATSCLGEFSRKIWENLVVLSVEKCCRKIPPKKGHGDHSHWRIHCSWIGGAKSSPEKSFTKQRFFGKTINYVAVCHTYVTLMSLFCDPITHPSSPSYLCPSGTIPRRFDLQRPYLSTARALGTQTFDETRRSCDPTWRLVE